MSKMTVIQLLNKIANGEELPKHIKYEDYNWFWCEACHIYETTLYNGKGNKTINLYTWFSNEGNLNDEVEIIEEDKKIKKICIFPTLDDENFAYEDGNKPSNVLIHHEIEKLLINKINEIIDKLNEMEKE